LNIFTATGRIGRYAETRFTAGGTAMASFSLAVDVGYGEKKSTLWTRCTIWGKRAEGGLIQYLKKGQEVVVSGEISLNEYQAKDGSNKASVELNVREIDLVGGKPQSQHDQAKANGFQPDNAVPAPDDDFDDSSIPF
jgi:single-strand DNA-binding protein